MGTTLQILTWWWPAGIAGLGRGRNELMPPPCKTEKSEKRPATRLPSRQAGRAACRTFARRKHVNPPVRDLQNHTSDLFSHRPKRGQLYETCCVSRILMPVTNESFWFRSFSSFLIFRVTSYLAIAIANRPGTLGVTIIFMRSLFITCFFLSLYNCIYVRYMSIYLCARRPSWHDMIFREKELNFCWLFLSREPRDLATMF